jgi:hypothetical protein
MALANYTDLLAAVANWLERGDLTARIPEFITLAEAEFNRRLRTSEMERTATATLTEDRVAVPTDFLGLRSFVLDGVVTRLDYVPPGDFFDIVGSGTPHIYTIADGMFQLRPSVTTGTCRIVYYQSIPPLTSGSPTNWLMTRWPDLYLFSTLMQAEFFGWHDDRLPLIKSRIEEIFAQIAENINMERYGGRRLMPRTAMVP